MYNNYNNPYFNQPRFQPMEPINQSFNNQQYVQPIQQQPNNSNVLLGKSVDSIEVVKAMDIPLDGSTSYFPLTDGSAIVTKKLQSDGTSKTVIYKPIQEKEKTIKYLTTDDLVELKDDMEELKKQIKEIKVDMKDRKK